MKARSLVLNIRLILLLLLFVLFAFGMQTILVSPSHPYVDDNGDGTDDLDEQNEELKDRAEKYGLKFPIAELGGCKNYYECRQYCEDPVNGAACITYAKKKGFHKEDELDKKKEEILEKAQKEFSCTSYGECKAFCQVPANFEKCNNFAKKHNMGGGHVDNPEEKRFLSKAKEILGCDSPQSCMNFCDNPGNRGKCSDFAKQLGLRGGQEMRGPGGCTSEETCQAFCSDPVNFQQCSAFGGGRPGGTEGGPQGSFRGPGGCDSEESCRSYCEQNPQDCRVVAPTSLGMIDNPGQAAQEYKKFCQMNPDSCASGGKGPFGSAEARMEFEKFCFANPQRCGAKAHYEDFEVSKQEGEAGGYVNPEDYCKKYPGRCPKQEDYKYRFEENRTYNPAEMCSRTPNCRWEGNTCQCGFYGGTSGSDPSPVPGVVYPTPPSNLEYPKTTSYPYPAPDGSTYTPPPGTTSYSPRPDASYTPPPFTPTPVTTTSTPPPSAPTPSTPPPSTPPPDSGSSGGSSGGSCPQGSFSKDGQCVQGVYGASTASGFWPSQTGLWQLLKQLFR